MKLLPFLISAQFLISISCCTPSFAKEEISVESVKEMLSDSLTRHQIRKLIDAIKEKIKEDPEDHTLYEALAFSYDYIGSYEQSIEAIKQQIKYHPDNDDLGIVYGNLARQYLNLGKPDEAKPAIDKSIELAPEDIINHRHLLNYYVLKGQYKELAIELKTISNLDKERDFYEDVYWLIKDKIKTYDEKINLFKEALNVNPVNAFAHKAYATILKESAFSNRKYKEALPSILAEYNKALELKPKYVFTYIAIGNTYFLLAKATDNKRYLKDAIKWFKKAEKLEPNNLKVQYAMGNMFYYTGEYDKAISKLEYVLNKDMNAQNVTDMLMYSYNNAAVACYTEKKDFKKGLELVDKALQFNPNAEFPLSTKAELLFKMGRTKEAEKYIQKTLAVKPDAEFFSRLGCEQQNINDFELAKRYYQESLKLDQNNAKTICNLGLVYTSLKEYDEAIDLFSRYIKLNPADFRGYYNLGVVYNNMGNKGSALRQVAKLSELKQEALAKELESVIKSGKIVDGKTKLLNE